MARFCTSCGAPMEDASSFCSHCGKSVPSAASAPVTAAPTVANALSDNIAGALAYITIFPAIFFLVVAPYNRNRFIRFHSFQCLFLFVAAVALNILIGFLPFVRWMLWNLLSLACFVLVVFLIIKAYQGQKFKVPVIGDMAEKQADSI